MFSANENIALRQHKRRIIQHVEECIPPEVLDMGTTVMVMQAACRAPGCVPLETLVLVVFPTTGDKELLPGLKESANGGTYKTKVLKPMADVTRQDVLEALPPAFPGGLRSTEKLCFQARDVMLAQITQLMGEDDLEGRQLMAEYLQECLQRDMKRGCVAPEYGEPFPDDNDKKESATTTTKQPTNGGNFVFRHVPEDEDERALPPMASVASTDGTSTNGKQRVDCCILATQQDSIHHGLETSARREQGLPVAKHHRKTF